MTTSSVTSSTSNSQVALLSRVNDDGSVSLNVTRKNGFARLPNRLHNHIINFTGIKSFSSLQAVDKQTQSAVKRGLEQFTDPMNLESSTCSRLLTVVYHMRLALAYNPREVLKDISTVAIRQKVLFLNPRDQNEKTTNLRHISEEDLETLEKTFSSYNPMYIKYFAAIRLIDKALAFPPHLIYGFTLPTDLLHGADLHAGLVYRRILLDPEATIPTLRTKVSEIIRVITLNEPNSTLFHIQAIDVTSIDETTKPKSDEKDQEMQLASERRKEDPYTSETLNEEIVSALKTAAPKVPMMLIPHLYTKDGKEIAQNALAKSALEYLMMEAMAVNISAKIGKKILYVVRPWSLGGKARTFS